MAMTKEQLSRIMAKIDSKSRRINRRLDRIEIDTAFVRGRERRRLEVLRHERVRNAG